MKKIMLFVLALCLCFTTFGAAFAETAAAEEAPKAEMTAEELRQAGLDAYNVKDYGKAMEYYQLAADLGNIESWRSIGFLYQWGFGVEQDFDRALEYYHLAADPGVLSSGSRSERRENLGESRDNVSERSGLGTGFRQSD